MTQTVYPVLRYRDARSAIEWLERAFGAARGHVYEEPGGVVAHAELRFGDDVVMLGSVREGSDEALAVPPGHAQLYVAVDDPDGHHDRAAAAGAEIVRELTDQDYGSRDYSARDPDGNLWSFGTYRPA